MENNSRILTVNYQTTGAASAVPVTPVKSKIDKILIDMLTKAVIATADEDGWVNLGAVGSHVAKQSPEFDSRNYGFARLSELVEATGKFDIDRSGKTQKGVLIHLKPASHRDQKVKGAFRWHASALRNASPRSRSSANS